MSLLFNTLSSFVKVQDSEIVGRKRNKGKKSIGIWDYWVNRDNSSTNKSQVGLEVGGRSHLTF